MSAMARRHLLPGLAVLLAIAAGCTRTVNQEAERVALLQRDREWAQSTKDVDKFVSFLAPGAAVYVGGVPVVTGSAEIKDLFITEMSTPGASLNWAPSRAEVSASGDLGYTTGTYETNRAGVPAETGKYVTIWKKINGVWKVAEDVASTDAGPPIIGSDNIRDLKK